jgi:undecaprenyl diphosphate synthase
LHVAIIMDGNGRWAAARGLPRAEGHRRGVEALRRVVRAANELGILYLTIFSFSSENWSRPATEIGDCSGCFGGSSATILRRCIEDGVRVRVIGERDGLEPDICALLTEAEDLTRDNRRLNLVVAFNYGSRQEIARAAQRLAREAAAGKRDPASIDADTLGQYLDAPDIPDPDLIIRTSGEQRLSNFLMWQAAYSELVFVPIHWPDFDKAALEARSPNMPARAPFRRSGRENRIVTEGEAAPASIGEQSSRNLLLRVVAALVLAPAGGWDRLCRWNAMDRAGRRWRQPGSMSNG